MEANSCHIRFFFLTFKISSKNSQKKTSKNSLKKTLQIQNDDLLNQNYDFKSPNYAIQGQNDDLLNRNWLIKSRFWHSKLKLCDY